MNRCVINLSTPKYKLGQERLRQTLFGNTSADMLFYRNEAQVGAPLHSEQKYAFKPFAFDKARRDGYDLVLWLDASMYVRKNIDAIFDEIEDKGYTFQDSGWMNHQWTTEEQAEYFGTNKGKMISAGVIGLDLRKITGRAFLAKWLAAAKDGMFNGSHDVTRHDQTAASLIIAQMGLQITANDTFWSYGQPDGEYSDNILIIANGIV